MQIITEELRKQNRILNGRENLEITQERLATFRRENALKEPLLRQQRHDRETKAALAVLEGEQTARPVAKASSPEKTAELSGKKATSTKKSSKHYTDPDEDKLIIFERYS